ncbi:MAG: UbiA family prenyltransferase [Polyangiaceae bacterium]
MVFVRAFVNCVVFDLRDTNGDRAHGIRTLPVVLGIRRTRHLLQTINAFAAVLIGLAVSLALLPWTKAMLLQCTTLYGIWYVGATETTSDLDLHCDVFVDGEWILFGLLAAFG